MDARSNFLFSKILNDFGKNVPRNTFFECYYSTQSRYGISRYKKMFDLLKIEYIFCKVSETSNVEGQFFLFGIDGNYDSFVKACKEDNYFIIETEDNIFTRYSEEEFDLLNKEFSFVFLFINDENISLKERVYSKISYLNNFSLVFPLSLCVILYFMFLLNFDFWNSLTSIPLLIGVLVSSILFFDSEKAEVSDKLDHCKSGENFDCGAVISSKYSKIFSFKLTHLGFSFFVTLVISYFYFMNFSILFYGLICAVPFVIYSLYIQKYILKIFCKFCLWIAGIISFNLLGLFLFIDINLYVEELFVYGVSHLIIFLFSFLLIFVIAGLYKKYLKLLKNQFEYFGLRRNFDIFYKKISDSHRLTPYVSNERIWLSGKAEDRLINLTLISNPMCIACSEAFENLLFDLQPFMNDINFEIRFFGGSNMRDPKAVICYLLYRVYNKYGLDSFISAYREWIKSKDFDKWISIWAQDFNMKNIKSDNDFDWYYSNNVYLTPSILINNKQIPSYYKSDDIVYFLDEFSKELTGNY